MNKQEDRIVNYALAQAPHPFDERFPVQRKRSLINRMLGDTSGPNDGNVRAIIAIIASVAVSLMIMFLLFEYTERHHAEIETLVTALVTGFFSITGTIVAFYFGARTSQTSK